MLPICGSVDQYLRITLFSHGNSTTGAAFVQNYYLKLVSTAPES